MTLPNEQDRRIAAWFQDPPARVPERTIEAVLAHARSHPRRRDPFAALRRDPMGSGGFGLGRVGQPLPLLAAVGLLLAAAFAGAAVGGWFDREPAVVPPIVSPSPSVAPPSDAPTPEPTPSTVRVDLLEDVGSDAFIDITDGSFTMTEAVSGDPGDRVDAPEGQVRVENDPGDPATIVLSWASSSCDTSHQLAIDADGRTMRMTRQPCEGDSLGGLGHVLRLTFDAPAPAAEFDVTLETTP
jgi:hypothetical protein